MESFSLQLIENLKYVGVFLSAFIEGPATAVLAGVLVKADVLLFTPALIAHGLGDFSADMMYFLIGKFGSKRFIKWFEKKFHASTEKTEKIKKTFHRHQLKIIFTGKLTHFLGLPIIIGIGLSNYSWKKFFLFNLIATIIKSTLLVMTGYGFVVIWKQFVVPNLNILAPILIILLLNIFYLIIKKKIEKKA